MKHNKSFLICLAALVSCWLSGQKALAQTAPTAQTDTLSKYYDMSIADLEKLRASGVSSELEKLINSIVGVASKKSLSARESPSIVSMITAEEIQKSGARDLMDVLRQVPGFDFGLQGNGIVGLGVRGNWAHEGKVLLMIDGQEMNEIFSASLTFGNHYPIENIQRIEIIRGPGSAVYGGFAEFAVINIITKKAELNGISAAVTGGQMQETLGRANVQVSAGKKIKNWELDASGFVGTANRSDNNDFFSFFPKGISGRGGDIDSLGKFVTLKDKSNIRDMNLNVGAKYKGLSFRTILDKYTLENPAYINKKGQGILDQSLNSIYSELKYEAKISNKLTLTPRVNIILQNPDVSIKNIPDSAMRDLPNSQYAMRLKSNLTGSYDFNRKLNVIFGGEYFEDQAYEEDKSTNDLIDSTKVEYKNLAFFAQGTYKTRLANIIVGARYDKNTRYGEAFVPRLGITKKIKRFNFKALYSQAFRAPSIQNVKLAYDGQYTLGTRPDGSVDSTAVIGEQVTLKPEKTSVFEIEVGYQLTRDMFLTANFYEITTRNAIVYYSTETTHQSVYSNFKKTGSRGVELEYKIRQKWGYLSANYAFYSTGGKDLIGVYSAREAIQNNGAISFGNTVTKNLSLGFPAHKVNLNVSYNITKKLTVNPSASFYSKRYGYDIGIKSDGSPYPRLRTFDPVLLANVFVRYENIANTGLTAGVGVYDLFNQQFKYVQPYYGLSTPMAGSSREFVVKLNYTLQSKK
ncbi:Outer membrane cobalamin receptor protein [Flexibacter flexilis DSM 6793]|uniref:Outer membrane cobalamin receptor protein n=1 Tax=Flexibacter flexilis DSM 6793 TaxID=927664 RepID=A0A1I1DI77_9BACT|nr:TonB-dependent receptor plug domain-containing protein [Flexibacter flexilis]SFB74534.1 Outer membrane cobalamin receptor protein [Flexibacter flexilis DSM 6793]